MLLENAKYCYQSVQNFLYQRETRPCKLSGDEMPIWCLWRTKSRKGFQCAVRMVRKSRECDIFIFKIRAYLYNCSGLYLCEDENVKVLCLDFLNWCICLRLESLDWKDPLSRSMLMTHFFFLYTVPQSLKDTLLFFVSEDVLCASSSFPSSHWLIAVFK